MFREDKNIETINVNITATMLFFSLQLFAKNEQKKYNNSVNIEDALYHLT